MQIQYKALDKGCDQVLWLLGENRQVQGYSNKRHQQILIIKQITEVGTMNVFIHWVNEDGGNSTRLYYL